jgi:hypothetical protein
LSLSDEENSHGSGSESEEEEQKEEQKSHKKKEAVSKCVSTQSPIEQPKPKHRFCVVM